MKKIYETREIVNTFAFKCMYQIRKCDFYLDKYNSDKNDNQAEFHKKEYEKAYNELQGIRDCGGIFKLHFVGVIDSKVYVRMWDMRNEFVFNVIETDGTWNGFKIDLFDIREF